MSAHAERAAEWVYHGVWQGLTAWLRVPETPPQLPVAPGDEAIAFKPSRKFLAYLKLYFWLILAFIDIALTAVWVILLVTVPLAGLLTLPLYLAVAIVPDIIAYIALHLRFDTTWYVLFTRSMRIRRGIRSIRETTITYENIQNVTITRGPVQRAFGIAALTVSTAGGGGGGGAHAKGASTTGGHVGLIEGVDNAEEIRDKIMARVRASRTAGLGDEHAGSHGGGEGQGAWTPAHLATLREIRDLAVAMRRA